MCATPRYASAVRHPLVEQPIERNILLRVGADQIVVRHARNGQNGLAVERGVIKAVQQMNPAGARGGQTHAEFARDLCVGARHERCGFLMADLHEANAVLPYPQCFHDAVDAVAR
jgi:hypothetical protein